MGASRAFGRALEEFHVGDVFEHWPHKTITDADNTLFCLLTMNHHPLHLDTEYARSSQHGRVVVVGTLVLSLVVGLSVRDVSGQAIANLSYDRVVHHHPVFVGDTLRALSRVVSVTPSATRTDRGVVVVETEAFNQGGERVISFTRAVLVPRAPRR